LLEVELMTDFIRNKAPRKQGLDPKPAERYTTALYRIPAPGQGCHAALLGVANLGIIAGLDGERIFQDIREHIPQGNRKVSDREIRDAVAKAVSDHNQGDVLPTPRKQPIVKDGKAALQGIIAQGKYCDEADLWEASPVRLLGEL
jgi:hypothetical protein